MTTPRELSDRELERIYSEANGLNAVAALRAVYNAGRNPPKEDTPTGTVHSAFTPETPTVPVTPARAGVTTPTRAETQTFGTTHAPTSVKK